MAATQQPRCRRRKNITTTELPVDVIFNNILPRLPAKYVKKYLCVSKEWYSFLKSPMFANMHANHATNDDHQNHHKLLVLYENENGNETTLSYSNRDCETQKPGMPRRRPLPFAASSIDTDDTRITSSCNGLVLVALCDRYDKLSHLIMWNPLTNDYKSLSNTNLNIVVCYENTIYRMYYNSSEQDYRVLLITGDDNDVYIYSLKSDSWRKINFECIPNSIPLSTCWNENLFFKKLFPESITMFDTKTEKFTNISIASIKDTWYSASVIVQRGCIHMCIKHLLQKDPCIKLWSMDRTGVWENTSTYTGVQGGAYIYMEPLHLMRDGNWLMKPEDIYKSYYKVDLENKHKEDTYPYQLKGIVAEVYIETFVSPNQYTN